MSLGIILSCSKDDALVVNEDEELILAYLDSAGLTDQASRDETGFYAYPITINPSGKTQASGSVLGIHYKLYRLDGMLIDVYDSLDGDTLIMKQGVNAIYPVGIDYALSYLKEGEEWGFIIPSKLAYGDYSYSTLIPENTIIRIDIKLLEIRSDDDVLEEDLRAISKHFTDAGLRDTVAYPGFKPEVLPNGMIYMTLEGGSGSTPATDQLVSVTYEGRLLDSTVFQRAPNADLFEFYYNRGIVIPGFETGVGKMKLQEKAIFYMPSYLGYRESAQIIPSVQAIVSDLVEMEVIPSYVEKVGPFEPLIFEIRLIDIN
ncbi:MAG: FKBP-type peptidyl-prolyl cis-trans isomerase [Marinoscillum sp.]